MSEDKEYSLKVQKYLLNRIRVELNDINKSLAVTPAARDDWDVALDAKRVALGRYLNLVEQTMILHSGIPFNATFGDMPFRDIIGQFIDLAHDSWLYAAADESYPGAALMKQLSSMQAHLKPLSWRIESLKMPFYQYYVPHVYTDHFYDEMMTKTILGLHQRALISNDIAKYVLDAIMLERLAHRELLQLPIGAKTGDILRYVLRELRPFPLSAFERAPRLPEIPPHSLTPPKSPEKSPPKSPPKSPHLWDIDGIVAHQRVQHGYIFQVQFTGHPASENVWYYEEDLRETAPEMVEQYMEDHNLQLEEEDENDDEDWST